MPLTRDRLPTLAAAAGCCIVVTAVFLLGMGAPGGRSAATAEAIRLTAAAHGSLIMSDEFTGPAGGAPNPVAWTALSGAGGWGNGELQSYTSRSSNLSLDGKGDLAITARREVYTGADGLTAQYTSARIVSTQHFQYGYLEARIYLPKGAGLWPAFWTVGADIYQHNWPTCGEIDVMEAFNDMTTVYGSLHGPTTLGTSAYAITNGVKPAGGVGGGWHTYAIDWTASAVTWYVDGAAYTTISKSSFPSADVWEFAKPHLVQLDLAVGGSWPGAPTSQTPFPATMLVDYVRLYATG